MQRKYFKVMEDRPSLGRAIRRASRASDVCPVSPIVHLAVAPIVTSLTLCLFDNPSNGAD
jgi:hypothetical protein